MGMNGILKIPFLWWEGLLNPPPSPLNSSEIFDKGEEIVFKPIWMPRVEARGASLRRAWKVYSISSIIDKIKTSQFS
jgi:hypothetical protein